MNNNIYRVISKKKGLALLIGAFFFIYVGSTLSFAQTKTYEPTWESLEQVPVAQWYDDAKFGIFVVWGPYSIPAWRPTPGQGYTEWFPYFMYKFKENEATENFMMERFGAVPPDFGYKDIVKMFKGEKFDPEDWANLFEAAGAKYVIQIGEFHAGFVMWDTDRTQWCATKMGPMRDIVGEVGEAVRKRGMKYGISTHRDRHYQYYPMTEELVEEMRREPASKDLYGPRFVCDEDYMIEHDARWKELIEKYQPDFMWMDAFVGNEEAWQWWHKYNAITISDYLNQAAERGQEVYFNNKGRRKNWPVVSGARSFDNMGVKSLPVPKWENPATMATSYGYAEDEEIAGDAAYRTPTELIQLLCDVVSKNGNLLLTVGPKGDGSISEHQRVRLIEIGKWLKVNGEAIYGTRTWTEYGESGGNAPKPVKRHTVPISPEKEIRYTKKEKVLYVHSLTEPTYPLTLTKTADLKGKVKKITLLGSDQKVDWDITAEGVVIKGPQEPEGNHVWVYKINLKR